MVEFHFSRLSELRLLPSPQFPPRALRRLAQFKGPRAPLVPLHVAADDALCCVRGCIGPTPRGSPDRPAAGRIASHVRLCAPSDRQCVAAGREIEPTRARGPGRSSPSTTGHRRPSQALAGHRSAGVLAEHGSGPSQPCGSLRVTAGHCGSLRVTAGHCGSRWGTVAWPQQGTATRTVGGPHGGRWGTWGLHARAIGGARGDLHPCIRMHAFRGAPSLSFRLPLSAHRGAIAGPSWQHAAARKRHSRATRGPLRAAGGPLGAAAGVLAEERLRLRAATIDDALHDERRGAPSFGRALSFISTRMKSCKPLKYLAILEFLSSGSQFLPTDAP